MNIVFEDFIMSYASSCSEKIFFVLDKTEIVQDKIFVQG